MENTKDIERIKKIIEDLHIHGLGYISIGMIARAIVDYEREQNSPIVESLQERLTEVYSDYTIACREKDEAVKALEKQTAIFQNIGETYVGGVQIKELRWYKEICNELRNSGE